MKNNWYIDSGATRHMCSDKDMFVKFEVTKHKEVILANSEKLKIVGMGEINITLISRGKRHAFKFSNVSYAPGLCANLLSVKQLTQAGYNVVFKREICLLSCSDGTILELATLRDGMYKLNTEECPERVNMAKDISLGVLWHRKLGHPGYQSMSFLREYVPELQIPSGKCEICVRAKHSKKPFKSSERHSDKPLQLIHMDVCGPLPEPSLGGHRYFVTFIDDFSKKVFLYVLSGKDEVFEKFKQFRAEAENQTERRIKAIKSDNGREFKNRKFDELCKAEGIIHQTTVAYNPQQNGVAERYNRTILERIRCMLLDARLPKTFWAEAAMTAVYLLNRIPKGRNTKSPNEQWYKKPAKLKDLRIFGEKAFVYVPKENRNKLEAKSDECLFMGYAPNGFRLYNTDKKKIVIARDVIFVEDKNEEKVSTRGDERVENAVNDEVILMNKELLKEEEGSDSFENFGDENANLLCRQLITHGIPTTYEEAVTNHQWREWEAAMKEEYQSLMENNTWTMGELPEGKKPIKCRWVFAVKRDVDGKIIRYKARLVAKGFSQIKGIDYTETFSPVVKYTSIRMLLAIAAHANLRVTQLDAVTAFLNGQLNEEIYMHQPVHFEDGTTKYCKLHKCIYGLKQASRVWNIILDEVLINFGLKKSTADQCIYFSAQDEYILILAIYVDDILIFSNNRDIEKKLCDELSNNFKMKYFGNASSILGIRIMRDEEMKTISIDQTQYIREVLERFNMINCNAVISPLEPGIKISKEMSPDNDADRDSMRNIPYRSAIGSLLFIAITTRPDIAFAVNLLSRYCENPGIGHWGAIKRIFRYLKGTIDIKITYGRGDVQHITGYSDADWAGDLDERKSTSGYIFTLYGGAISWNCKRQPTVALSSTEAEYMSAVSAIQEAIWLRSLYKEMFKDDLYGIPLYVDNRGAIHLILNNVVSGRTKHIQIKIEFIKESVKNGEITIKYMPTSQMPADIMTKAVPGNNIMKHLPCIGLSV